MRVVVIGATAGLGRSLSEALASSGADLLLVASDIRDLDVFASHLHLVYGIEVKTLASDAKNTKEFVETVCETVKSLDFIDSIMFPIGVSLESDKGNLSLDEILKIFSINMLIVTGIISSLLPSLLEQPQVNIVGFSSIAAIRGRKSNVIYSSAKRSLESYFESLQHLVSDSKVKVQLYRLGYVETQQSFGKKLLFPVAKPDKVAMTIIKNLHKSSGRFHCPKFWILIGSLVKLTPWSIYRKLNF